MNASTKQIVILLSLILLAIAAFIAYMRINYENFEEGGEGGGEAAPAEAAPAEGGGGEAAPADAGGGGGGDAGGGGGGGGGGGEGGGGGGEGSLGGAVDGAGGAAATVAAYTEDAILKQARDTSGHTGTMLKNQQKERQYLIGSLTKEKKEREMDEEIAKQTYDRAVEAHDRAKKNLSNAKDLAKRSATAEVSNKPFDPKKAFAAGGGEDPNAAAGDVAGGL
jgi:hypothetical protein